MKKIILLCVCTLLGVSMKAQTDTIRVGTVNGYINEGAQDATIASSRNGASAIQLKKGKDYERWGYLSFPLDNIDENKVEILLNLFVNTDQAQIEVLENDNINLVLYGITGYVIDDNVSWGNKTEPTPENETYLGYTSLTKDMAGKYLKLHVTEFIKQQKSIGATTAYFRIRIDSPKTTTGVVYFRGGYTATETRPPLLVQNTYITNPTVKVGTVNGFINEGDKDKSIATLRNANATIYLRKSPNYNRHGFLSFPLDEIDEESSDVTLKIWLPKAANTDAAYPGSVVSLWGLKYTVTDDLTWNTYNAISPRDEEPFAQQYTMTADGGDVYLEWNVTDFVKARKSAGEETVQFRLDVLSTTETNKGMVHLKGFRYEKTNEYNLTPPVLDQILPNHNSTISKVGLTEDLFVYPTLCSTQLNLSQTVAHAVIYDLTGAVVKEQRNTGTIDVSSLNNGVYFIKAENKTSKFIKK